MKKLKRLIGVHNVINSIIAEKEGFDGLWLSSLELSASLGIPDLNILTPDIVGLFVKFITNRVKIPLIVDADTGYGYINNVIYAVKEFEKQGAAGLCMEDQIFPKINSLLKKNPRQDLPSLFSHKIKAAKHARKNRNFLIFARIESFIAGKSLADAIKRARLYVKSGADVVLIHSKNNTPDKIVSFVKRYCKEELRAPIAVVPTTYPDMDEKMAMELGIEYIIYANHCLRASIDTVKKILKRISKDKGIKQVNNLLPPVKEIFRLQKLEKYQEDEYKIVKN